MTNDQIAAIVGTEPQPWWPKRVYYHGPAHGFSTCHTDPDPERSIEADHVYLIFVGHLWTTAAKEGVALCLYPSGRWMAQNVWDSLTQSGPTPLHALVAYFQAKEANHD